MVSMVKVNKYIVSDQAFEDAMHLPYYKIPFIEVIETGLPVQYDFIIIKNGEGTEIIRNFLNSDGNQLEYTSCLNGSGCKTIALTVIMTLLYQSIMWIRHGTYIQEGSLFASKEFPFRRLEYELNLICGVLNLCEGKIDIKTFIDILEQYQKNADDFLYYSAFDILDQYPWQFDLTDIRKEKIGLIESSVNEIRCFVKNKSRLEEVCKIGYKIHNEPHFILENTDKF